MPGDQILMGAAVAVLSLAGLWQARWIVENTRKGRRLVRWFGEQRAMWVLRGLFFAGIVFGVLLATDVIRPVQW